ncbi:MAG: prolyl oligopeptidase family serine peptidase [Bacteroidetes bacterium]|jgi:dipeptidyl-peptidase-4|nr:prolyl oligopeptidase family serine peptidase [Bacteroidota bacterium]
MRKIGVLLLVAVSFLSFSQDKLLTINDAITGYHLYPKGLRDVQWLPGGQWFSQVATLDGKQVIEVQEIAVTKGRNIIVTLDDINAALPEGKTLSRLPRANWISDKEFQFITDKQGYAYDIEEKGSRALSYTNDAGIGRVQYFDDGSGIYGETTNGFAYSRDNEGKEIGSNTDGIVIGKTVHRSEFGITNGLFPSPSHELMAYYEMDERMVTQYPLYVLADTPATVQMIRYPTAGAKSHHVQVKIKNMATADAPITIQTTGDKEQYLTNVSWSADEKYVLIAIVNRAQNHMWLNKYDAKTGAFIKTLFEEQNKKYVEPEHPAVFLKNDPNKFIWWSERDGYNHLYLYDLEGNMLKQLTKGQWIVTEYHGMSAEGDKFYITATKDSPLERHLYCVNVKNGKMKNLTQTSGYHGLKANKDCSLFIDDYSNTGTPRAIRLIDGDGNLKEVIHQAENPLAEYKIVQMELGKLKGNSGDDLYYRVFKPIDFDANKKYPVVVYLYNGPHLQLITNRWLGGANLWYQYMAQQGYVVFSIDGRGSADRGFAFESAIHRNCGEKEMEDQLTGVEWLKKQSWVDADRLGIHGWSYGGFMTTSVMSRHPGVFKVGVAGGPVIDWTLYEVMYTERYMDTPQENPEGYERTNLKNHVQNLDGKLLMIHGGQDNVVLWQHSLQFLEKAIDEGVQLDYFVYPNHEHNVRGKDRIHLYQKVSEYFFDHL